MMDFARECFTFANFTPTLMIIGVVLYWLMVIFGVVGLDMFDIEVDVDTDLGMDADFGFDADVHGGVSTAPGSQLGGGNTTTGNESIFRFIFDFFFLGDVPIVIIGSFFAMFFWITSFVVNHYFNPEQHWLTALIWLTPNIIVSLILTRLALYPVAILFRKPPPENTTRDDMFGLIGMVTTSEVTSTFGQIEIRINNEPEITLNARTAPGVRLARGDAAKILAFNNDDGTFLVELTKWENESDD